VFSGGVPSGQATTDTITLTAADVVRRALDNNLGVLAAQEGVDRARGARWQALSELLPNVSGRVAESRQKNNLEAFGFPLGPEMPRVVGPFNVFDARLHLSQSIFDWRAINRSRAGSHALAAERHEYRNARDLVVLVAANLYLQTLESQARAEAARARLQTSEALHSQALDMRQNGIVAGIDVVRAEVRMSADRQQVTIAQNEFEKRKLQLARVIGLPIGQAFTLEELKVDVPMPDLTLETALDRAYRSRADFLAAQERVEAAQAASRAARGEFLPSAHLNADYGAIGLSAGTSLSTFNVTGSISVPIFQGGRAHGAVIEADAALRQRRAEAEDLRAEIYYDVRAAFLDLQATGEELQTATRSRELAELQLTQARDRFAAGVANNVEVVQAQEAVALASEQYISALYGFNLSKALLARSVGTAEDSVLRYLGEARP
jgi:outer membrane protein TolC